MTWTSFLYSVTAFLTLLTILGLWSPWYWLSDGINHFRAQYMVAGLFCLILLCILSSWKWATLALTISLIQFIHVLPLFLPISKPLLDSPSSAKLKLLEMNVFIKNTRYQQALSYIRQKDPDVLVIVELNPNWETFLQENLKEYIYTYTQPRKDASGIGIFSRLPLDNVDLLYHGPDRRPTLVTTLSTNNQPFHLVATHPPSPRSLERIFIRNSHLTQLAEELKTLEHPYIIVGDFNITHWSKPFKHLMTQLNLKDTQLGFGFQPSWHERLMPFAVPIDHCLVTHHFQTLKRQVGPNAGSDHLPLYIELLLNPTLK